MPNLFVYGTLMRRYVNPWKNTIEKRSLSILLNIYETKFSKVEETQLIWKKENPKPLIISRKNSIVIGEVLLDASEDVVNIVGKYVGPRKFYRKILVETEDVRGERIRAYTFVYEPQLDYSEDEVFKTLVPIDDLPENFRNIIDKK